MFSTAGNPGLEPVSCVAVCFVKIVKRLLLKNEFCGIYLTLQLGIFMAVLVD